MDLEQVVTGLYGQYIPSLARRKASNKFDFIKQGTLSVQEFATELELYASQMGCDPCYYEQGMTLRKSRYINCIVKRLKLKTLTTMILGFAAANQRLVIVDGSIMYCPTLGAGLGTMVLIGPRVTLIHPKQKLIKCPWRAGPPISNRQQTNHDSSNNSIECYNCGKSGHIKPNCPEPIKARHVGVVHIEDSPTEQVDNTDHGINDPIDDEHPTEDEYHNKDYDNQLDLSEDQRSWGSKPSKFDWSDDDQPCRVNSV
ncbi:hypothetical protein M422DRAFT_273584 [Sphaerobolus stellatus SS14]|uniref:Unplaced genomic scaffold SPHSTscaffold_339, whole genome shotgun sequence n=1 Tax=Sphaerobolus stellatus (strain SS14) TaxID=990650 RepID=A0A0C9U8U3_SPHS4|nr:hypothetical protein M422DRAFT_273584 [Sphaerobolus stellatus SS14]